LSTSDYVEASTLARDEGSEVRRSLAANTDTAPEILYFLAEDAHPEVRRAIANNPASPRQADIVLAGDSQASVRLDLARKISRLAPDLSRHEKTQLETLTLEALGLLAADVLPRVRQIIAEELKTLDNVPAEMMLLLARDVELVVAAPSSSTRPYSTTIRSSKSSTVHRFRARLERFRAAKASPRRCATALSRTTTPKRWPNFSPTRARKFARKHSTN
jgi:hypothetical protein